MKFFRNDAIKKKVLWATTIIIILSFGVFGTAYLIAGNTGSANTYAGSIFGEKILMDDFFKQQKHAEIQAIMRYGENYRNVRQYLNLDADTWNRLLLLHEADNRKVKISNNDVINAIEALPYFQRNNQYDTLIYNDVLRYVFKIKPRDFEEGVRDNLKITKIFEEETRTAYVSDEDAFVTFRTDNEQTKVKYVLIEPDAYIDPAQYDETQARLYWVENKSTFAVPSSINVSYIEFPLPETDDESEKDKVRSSVDEIVNLLKEDEELENVAKEKNLTIQTTGFFSKENPKLSLGWSFEMLNTLFGMNIDQMAGPFELDDRLVVARLSEKKETYVPEYEEVVEQVKEAYLKQQALGVTKTKAQEYLKKIQDSADPSFENAATALGLNVQKTPNFTRGEYLPKIGISKEFETAAFSLNAQQRLSDVIETSIGYAILSLEEYTAPSQSDFEEQKESLKARLLQEKQNELFNQFLTNLRFKSELFDNVSRLRQQQAAAQAQ